MDKLETIKSEATELISKMITQFEIEVAENEGAYLVTIKAEEEAPTIIGRHGETIRAIQKILEVVLYKKLGESMHVLINVNDYRERQKEKLEALATETVEKTKSTGEQSYLTNLSSYERKMIHEFITKNYPDLTSYSVGEGRERKLVIEVKKA